MKILKIHFKNINSLEGEHEIDFTQNPFTQSHLFAITGATGSGKSTILDVIPLALYNKIPRLESAISKKLMLENGAILTRGQTQAFARVTYACKRGIFTTEWHVRVASTGNLQDYEMFLYDSEGRPITQKKSEVPAKNEELIGLNYEQFIKSVMLAQGEFSRFLKVKKEERSALLEQITGTAIYRKLGQAAYEKFKAFKNSVQEWESRVAELDAKILPVEKLESIQNQEKELNEIQKNLKLQLKELEQEIEAFLQWKIQKKQICELTKQEETTQKSLDDFNQNEGKKLIYHEKTNDFSEQLFDWNTKKIELECKQNELHLKSKEKLSAENQINEALKAVQKWVKNPSLKSAEIDSALSDFYQKIKKWEEKRTAMQARYKELKAAISAELKVLNLSFEKVNPTQLSQNLIELNKFSKPLKISKNEFMAQKERLQDAIENLLQGEKTAQEILQFKQNNAERKKKLQLWSEEKVDLSTQLKQLEKFLSLQKLKVEKLELEIQNRELQKTLADYRSGLEADKPCPLCGAIHHPWANKTIEKTDELHEKFKKEKIFFEKQHEEKIKLETNFLSLKKNITNLEKEIFENEEKAANLIQVFQTEFPDLEWNTDFTPLISEKKNSLKNLEVSYEAFLEKNAIEVALPLYEELNKITQQGQDLKKKILAETNGADLYEKTQNLQKKWQQAQSELRHTEQNLKDLNELISQKEKIFKGLEKNLENQIKNSGFKSISSAFEKRLHPDEVKTLSEKKSNLIQFLEKLKVEKNVLQKSFDALDLRLQSLDLEKSQLAKTEVISKLESNEILLKEFFAQQHQQQIYKSEIQLLKEKIATENKEIRYWRMLNELIGDAKGKKFNDFAQDLTLSQLLHLANKRLIQLKSRYWLTQPEANEDDGLMAIDQDMGNQRRSVKTLSGGETFILSLALALGLSDLAAQNVCIETLFIDEGFGTLDPETLDKTMDTLERLQQENQKMIGIISHVEMLKERISTQIQIKQNGNGMSGIEVVG